GTPMIVVYKTSAASFAVGKLLVRVPWISLANIVAGEEVVPELLQDAVRADRLEKEGAALLDSPDRLARMREGLARAAARLGPPGAPSGRRARRRAGAPGFPGPGRPGDLAFRRWARALRPHAPRDPRPLAPRSAAVRRGRSELGLHDKRRDLQLPPAARAA